MALGLLGPVFRDDDNGECNLLEASEEGNPLYNSTHTPPHVSRVRRSSSSSGLGTLFAPVAARSRSARCAADTL